MAALRPPRSLESGIQQLIKIELAPTKHVNHLALRTVSVVDFGTFAEMAQNLRTAENGALQTLVADVPESCFGLRMTDGSNGQT